MDDFTQKMYAAAQARQKKIDTKFDELGIQRKIPLHESQPNLPTEHMLNNEHIEKIKRKDSQSEPEISQLKENFSSPPKSRSGVTRVSSEMPGKDSPKFAHKTLNIQKENFEMEIKLRSSDDVRVEVEIEERDEDEHITRSHESIQPLRKEVKTRLQRLGRLYAEDDLNISSPISRNQEKFDESVGQEEKEKSTPDVSKQIETEARKKRLAQLASNLNTWEDDLSHPKPVIKETIAKSPPRKSWKQPAPQPPKEKPELAIKPTATPTKKTQAPKPPPLPQTEKEIEKPGSPSKSPSKKLNWDKKVLDTLECQGFSRIDSGSNLPQSQPKIENTPEKVLDTSGIENNSSPIKKVTQPEKFTKKEPPQVSQSRPMVKSPSKSILSKAAMFENGSPTKSPTKDPALLSLAERKALFEKNKGEALIPKAAFGMAAPVKSDKIEVKPKPEVQKPKKPVIVESTVKPTTTSANENSGIAGKLKALLHQATTISESQIKNARNQEKEKELQMLKNRFVKPKELEEKLVQEDVVDSEEVDEEEESDSDNEEISETKQMLKNQYSKNVTFKHSRESLASLTSKKSLSSLKKSIEETSKSLLGSRSSMQKLNESPSPKREKKLSKRRSSGDHPVVQAVLEDVKRVKVSPPKNGHLYPCLSDIEASTAPEDNDQVQSSVEHSDEDNQSSIAEEEDSSLAESDMADTSFGREILAAVNRNNAIMKTTANMNESTTTSSDLSDVLNDMNEYLDGQTDSSDDDAGPTPPKTSKTRGAVAGGVSSSSFHYTHTSTSSSEYSSNNSPVRTNYMSPSKTKISPQKELNDKLPTHILDGDSTVPLIHTVSFYRKQQNQEQRTPVKKITRQKAVIIEEDSPEPTKDSGNQCDNEKLIDEKIQQLMDEVCKQQTVISQASQALNLCGSTIEFSGSCEEVEAERLLLLATQRRQASLHEAQRLRIERTLRPISTNRGMIDVDRCSITISEICLPLKRDYIRALTAAGGLGHHLLCLVRYAERVLVTPLVATGNPPNPPQIIARIPGSLKLEHIYPDFTITVEVYSLQAHEEIIPHEVKYHIGGKDKKSKMTPKKSKQDSKLHKTSIQSPAGPSAVRTSSFQLMGYIIFSIREVNRTQWSLNKVPYVSPLEGQILMNVDCNISVNVEMHGFLTMFEDVSGFGAWHRRWCYLKGETLSYWRYPDDERKKPPINSISLQGCITENVTLVSRDICARPNTFLLEFVRPKQSNDVDSLVTVVQDNKTLIRHLLSADTKEERIEWCQQLNKALGTMKSISGK